MFGTPIPDETRHAPGHTIEGDTHYRDHRFLVIPVDMIKTGSKKSPIDAVLRLAEEAFFIFPTQQIDTSRGSLVR